MNEAQGVVLLVVLVFVSFIANLLLCGMAFSLQKIAKVLEMILIQIESERRKS